MKVDLDSMSPCPESLKALALEEINETIQATADNIPGDALVDTARIDKSKRRARRQNDRQRVEQQVNDIFNQHRREHEATHRRSLAVCRIDRCNVCGAGISVAYVGALQVGACGVGVMTEEVILSGTLSSLAIAQLSARVTTAGGSYASGWTSCASMT